MNKYDHAKDFEGLHYQCPYCGSYETKFANMQYSNPEAKLGYQSLWTCITCTRDFFFHSIRNYIPKWDKNDCQ